MRSDLGFILGNCHKHLRHSVTDIILDDILYKKHCDKHSKTWIYEIKEVVSLSREPGRQPVMEELHETLQCNCSQTAENSDKKRKEHNHITLRHLHQNLPYRR